MPTRLETRDRFAKYDIDEFTKEVKNEIVKIYKKALTSFVQESAKHIPVLTGQARSALIGAAKELGLDPRISLSAAPVTIDPKRRAQMLARGNNPKRGQTLGHGTLLITEKQGTFRLVIEITEKKYGYDYFSKWEDEVWHSLPAGKQVLKDVIDQELSKLSFKLRTK